MTRVLLAFGLVLLCMMPFATSAAAECAWVLWERTWIDRRGPPLLDPELGRS